MKFGKKIKALNVEIIKNQKGNIFKTFNKKNINFKKLQEMYFSTVKFNSIKAWKFHKKMQLFLTVPVGKVKFVFFDQLTNKFYSTTIGEKKQKILIVKPKIWFGFKGLGKRKNLIVSCSTLKHNKSEILRKKIKEIKYKW